MYNCCIDNSVLVVKIINSRDMPHFASLHTKRLAYVLREIPIFSAVNKLRPFGFKQNRNCYVYQFKILQMIFFKFKFITGF